MSCCSLNDAAQLPWSSHQTTVDVSKLIKLTRELMNPWFHMVGKFGWCCSCAKTSVQGHADG